nr:MAG TPA: hypothetical protein [Caudoviricetes sp.]
MLAIISTNIFSGFSHWRIFVIILYFIYSRISITNSTFNIFFLCI